MLDEPVNGLDPEGILWIRGLLRDLADEGRTVFVSSHLMSEMAMIADHYVIVGRGRLIADVPAGALAAMAGPRRVRVRTPQPDHLAATVRSAGGTVDVAAAEIAAAEVGASLLVTGLDAEEIGTRAAAAGIVLYELTPHQVSLEDLFMELTRDAVEYHASDRRAA
jgi:ABC-2 type transport system ATP-binding protein